MQKIDHLNKVVGEFVNHAYKMTSQPLEYFPGHTLKAPQPQVGDKCCQYNLRCYPHRICKELTNTPHLFIRYTNIVETKTAGVNKIKNFKGRGGFAGEGVRNADI